MKPRSNTILALALLVGVLAIAQGCKTTGGQRTAYNTIATVQDTVDGAYDAYFEAVATQLMPTNDLPAVSKALNVEHAAAIAAINQLGSTNALSPYFLNRAAEDFLVIVHRVYVSYGRTLPKKVTETPVWKQSVQPETKEMQ